MQWRHLGQTDVYYVVPKEVVELLLNAYRLSTEFFGLSLDLRPRDLVRQSLVIHSITGHLSGFAVEKELDPVVEVLLADMVVLILPVLLPAWSGGEDGTCSRRAPIRRRPATAWRAPSLT